MKKLFDLYGAEVCFIHTAQKYNFVRYARSKKSGFEIEKAAIVYAFDFSDMKIWDIVEHHDGSTTIKTVKHGIYKFFN